MKKIMITSYYELKEVFLCIRDSFLKLGYEVCNYPLYQNYMDEKCRIDNYVDDFIQHIKNQQPDVILWWYIGIPHTDMTVILEPFPNIKNFFFNWDEPHNWKPMDLANKAKHFDCAFITCEETTDRYINNGSNDAVFLMPGYDPKFHKILLDDEMCGAKEFRCDISMCCTNLYVSEEEYPNQWVRRKELVDNIYKNQKKRGYVFHIYGPELFKTLYPDSYKGFLRYENTVKLFNYSKINICTHVQRNYYKYFNERVVLILGSGGLLFCDDVEGVHDMFDTKDGSPGQEIVVYNRENYIDQIMEILNNYDEKYWYVRNRGHLKSQQWTWDEWAKVIVSKI